MMAALTIAAPVPDLDARVRAAMRRTATPGVAVGVFRAGTAPIYRTYGVASLELPVPVSPKTLFQSGSLGKQFTAALILLLAQDGRLSLGDSIGKFFPEANGKWDGITVEQLIHHTSGLPDLPYALMDLTRPYSEAQLVEMMAKGTPFAKPGTQFRYNNGGYVLLGALVRRVTGRFYGDELTDRIFRPLGMRTARMIDEAAIIPNRAAGYEPEFGPRGEPLVGTVRNQSYVSPSLNATADGGLYVSLEDMRRWDDGLRRSPIFSEKTREFMMTSGRLADDTETGYAAGWTVATIRGIFVMAHNGIWQGFSAYFGRLPKQGVSVVVLANHRAFPATAFGDFTLAEWGGVLPPKPKGKAKENPRHAEASRG